MKNQSCQFDLCELIHDELLTQASSEENRIDYCCAVAVSSGHELKVHVLETSVFQVAVPSILTVREDERVLKWIITAMVVRNE